VIFDFANLRANGVAGRFVLFSVARTEFAFECFFNELHPLMQSRQMLSQFVGARISASRVAFSPLDIAFPVTTNVARPLIPLAVFLTCPFVAFPIFVSLSLVVPLSLFAFAFVVEDRRVRHRGLAAADGCHRHDHRRCNRATPRVLKKFHIGPF